MADEIRMAIELRADESRLSPEGWLAFSWPTVRRRGIERKSSSPDRFRGQSPGIVVNRQHQRTAPVLRATPILDGNVVRIDAQIPDTSAAGTQRKKFGADFSWLSVEFKAVRQTIVAA